MNNEETTKPPPKYRMVPPDGGFGWVIVGASFILSLLSHSVPIAFGVIYMYLVNQEGFSNAAVSVLPALLICTSNLLAPVATALSRFYNYRILCLIGMLFIVAGLLLSSISLNIIWLYFTYGILAGIGHGLVTPMIFLIGQQYFNVRRVAAHALSTLGTPTGMMLIPFLILNLIQMYTLKGAFLVWSAVIFQGLVAVMFYHPVEWHLKPQIIPEQEINLKNTETAVTIEKAEETRKKLALNRRNSLKNFDATKFLSLEYLDEERFYDDTAERPKSFMSVNSYDSYKTTRSTWLKDGRSVVSMVSCLEMPEYYQSAMSLKRIQGSDLDFSSAQLTPDSHVDQSENKQVTSHLKDENAKKTVKQEKNYNQVLGLKLPKLSDVLKFRLLKIPLFTICCSSSICNRQLYYSFSTYIPTLASEVVGVERIPILIFLVSGMDILSKFLMALISDRGWLSRRYFYIIGSLINFSAIITVTQSTSFTSLALGCSLFGFGIGISSSIGPVLMVEYLSIDQLSYTFGLTLFIGGIFSLVSYMFQGWSIDFTSSTTGVCLILAALAITPAFLWTLASIFLLKESGKKKQSDKS